MENDDAKAEDPNRIHFSDDEDAAPSKRPAPSTQSLDSKPVLTSKSLDSKAGLMPKPPDSKPSPASTKAPAPLSPKRKLSPPPPPPSGDAAWKPGGGGDKDGGADTLVADDMMLGFEALFTAARTGQIKQEPTQQTAEATKASKKRSRSKSRSRSRSRSRDRDRDSHRHKHVCSFWKCYLHEKCVVIISYLWT